MQSVATTHEFITFVGITFINDCQKPLHAFFTRHLLDANCF